jgi:hypothetical protein
MAPPQKPAKMPRRPTPRERLAYEVLAQALSAGNCRVTVHQIHNWVEGGLVPRMTEAGRVRGLPVFAQPVATWRQARAACEYRRHLGELDRIAVQLFLDGYSCPEPVVVAGFALEEQIFHRYATSFAADEPDQEDRRIRITAALARSPEAMAAAGHVPLDERRETIQSLTEFLADGTEMSDYARAGFSRTTGIDFASLAIDQISPEDFVRIRGDYRKMLDIRPLWLAFESEFGIIHRNASTQANRRAIAFIGLCVFLEKLPSTITEMFAQMAIERGESPQMPETIPVEYSR